jgi:integrase
VKGSIKRYCACVDPGSGRQFAVGRCPEFVAKPKHGWWEYRDRLLAGSQTKLRTFRRRGFATRTATVQFHDHLYELLGLARGDRQLTAAVGDLVFAATKRHGQLPAVEDVRRRLGIGRELDRSQLTREWFEQSIAGKRKLRESTARGYRAHLDHFLTPLLGDIPLDRLTPEHIADMFDVIEAWNAEIREAREQGRQPVLDGDVRHRSGIVGVATERRTFATLRTALNAALKSPRRIDYNPCEAVEMPGERPAPALVWSPEQVATFLDATVERLGLLFRLVLLRGLRRGEAVGLAWSGVDLDHGQMRIAASILQLGGKVVQGLPKTQAGERSVSLDRESVALLRRHRTAQKRERLAWGAAYEDHDLMFCREDGTPYPPDYVSRRFRELAVAAGLPRIKLHEGRHRGQPGA